MFSISKMSAKKLVIITSSRCNDATGRLRLDGVDEENGFFQNMQASIASYLELPATSFVLEAFDTRLGKYRAI